MEPADSDTDEPEPRESADRPWVKRRWAIMRSASGGVAVIAIAGAIALGDPTDQVDTAGDSGPSSPQISAES